MKQKITKKHVTVFIVLVLLFFMIWTAINQVKGQKKADKEQDIPVSEEAESSGQIKQDETTDETGDDAALPVQEEADLEPADTKDKFAILDDETVSDEEKIWIGGMIPQDIDLKEDDPGASQEYTKKIGKIEVTYNTETASSISGTAELPEGAEINIITFNNGEEDGLYGMMMGAQAYKGMVAGADDIDHAKQILSEFIPEGSGTLCEWEETSEYFVRYIVDYDLYTSRSYITYTAVPKHSDIDDTIYFLSFIMGGEHINGNTITEDDFKRTMEPLQKLIPDSTYLDTDYTKCQAALFNRTGNSNDNFNLGLQSLRNGVEAYYENTYGVSVNGSGDGVSTLTQEEMDDLRWRHDDPVGYAQMHGMEESDMHYQIEDPE